MATGIKTGGRDFKKGQSGNPNGRPPKGYSITEMMQEMLASTPELKASIGKVIAKKALEGDITAVKMLWNYMDGMPKQVTDLHVKELPKPLLSSLDEIENDVLHHNGTQEVKETK